MKTVFIIKRARRSGGSFTSWGTCHTAIVAGENKTGVFTRATGENNKHQKLEEWHPFNGTCCKVVKRD